MNTEVISIPLDQIEVGDRLRVIDPDHAGLIAESFHANGQMTPIEVRRAPGVGYRLIAGAHRLEAANIAGMATISAVVVEADDDQARLREIDENLCRRDLSELDRATFLAERKAVWDRLHPETARRGRRAKSELANGGSPIPTFTKEVAEKLGLGRRAIEKALRRHTAITPNVRLMLATTRFADSASTLDALAKLPATQQVRAAAALIRAEKPCRTVGEALIEILGAPTEDAAAKAERQFAALVGAWRKADRGARRRFVDFLVAEGELPGPAQEAA